MKPSDEYKHLQNERYIPYYATANVITYLVGIYICIYVYSLHDGACISPGPGPGLHGGWPVVQGPGQFPGLDGLETGSIIPTDSSIPNRVLYRKSNCDIDWDTVVIQLSVIVMLLYNVSIETNLSSYMDFGFAWHNIGWIVYAVRLFHKER